MAWLPCSAALRAVLPWRQGRRLGLLVADASGATAWQLDAGGQPVRGRHRALGGLRRTFLWQQQVWLAGRAGVVSFDGQALALPCCEAVIDADAQGEALFMLSGRALWLAQPGAGQAQAQRRWLMDTPAELVAVHHESLALADGSGLRIHPRRGSILGAPIVQALRGVVHVEATTGPGDSYLAVDAEGRSWIVSLTGSRVWISAQRDVAQPMQIIRMLGGGHVAVASRGQQQVMLARVGRARVLQRE